MSQLTLKSLLMSAFICDFERVSGLKKASEAWIQGFCVTTVWGWHRLWQAGKDFCHFWYSAYVIFVILLTSTIFIFQLKMLHKKHSKGGFPAPKNIKNTFILDPLTPAKKNYTCTAYVACDKYRVWSSIHIYKCGKKVILAVLLQNAHFCWRWYLETFASLRCSICIEIVNMTFQAFPTHQSLFLSTSCQWSQL